MGQPLTTEQDAPKNFDHHSVSFPTRHDPGVPTALPAQSGSHATTAPTSRVRQHAIRQAMIHEVAGQLDVVLGDCNIPDQLASRHDVSAVPTTTTVVVVDDHRTFSDLLAMALEREPDLSCVGTAAEVSEALAIVERLRPDLVLMDVHLGDGDGIVATAELTQRYPELRVVVLSAHIDTALMLRAADAGACALLPKDGFLSDMLTALRTSRRGGFAVHPALLATLITAPPPVSAPPALLTRRENDVLGLMALGQDARAIAKNLRISTSTCRGYVQNVLVKLGAHSQLEAVVIATNHGLVSIGTHR